MLSFEVSECKPMAGGLYYYLRTSFGGAVAFSWTYINFTVVVPGRG
jgi:amino acid transporter